MANDRGGFPGSSALILLPLVACASCDSTPDLVLYESSHCQLVSAPTLREGTPAWVGCRVAIERGTVEQLLVQLVTADGSGSFFSPGDEWLVVRLNRNSPATGRVTFRGGSGVQPPVGTAWVKLSSSRRHGLCDTPSGEGTLTTNVSSFDPGDFRLTLTFDGVRFSGSGGGPTTLDGVLSLVGDPSTLATRYAPMDASAPDAGDASVDAPPDAPDVDAGPTPATCGACAWNERCQLVADHGVQRYACARTCSQSEWGSNSVCPDRSQACGYDLAGGLTCQPQCATDADCGDGLACAGRFCVCTNAWCARTRGPGFQCAVINSIPTCQCVPDRTACRGRACGGVDSCGNPCFAAQTCANGQTCTADGRCVGTCVPDCMTNGRYNCGPDGCGGLCPTRCPAGSECVAGVCTGAPCTPDCAGHNCGDDGCGGSCGACASGRTCVGGVCSGGGGGCSPACSAGQTCVGGVCVTGGTGGCTSYTSCVSARQTRPAGPSDCDGKLVLYLTNACGRDVYCRAIVVDGSATSSLSGMTIRAGETVGGALEGLFTCNASSRASWVYRCAAPSDPADCTAVP